MIVSDFIELHLNWVDLSLGHDSNYTNSMSGLRLQKHGETDGQKKKYTKM